jgi:hypothetical protein
MLNIYGTKNNNILSGQVGAHLAKNHFYTSHFISDLTRLTHISAIAQISRNRRSFLDTPLAKAEGILDSQNRLADAESLQHR